ncbi:MAG: biotin--[acetyl-CoA-carboxylase] ligase [Nitrosomonadales bacterium]|nr:biotin--[acetyl-CoA-carboxylase] ligase [Nitrosomonadales bacterium]
MSGKDAPGGHARLPLLNPLPRAGEEANGKSNSQIKPLTFALLRRLADSEFHSGETLAREFGVTRATVCNALHDIDRYGLTLYSVRGRGYRLARPLQWLDAGLIRSGLGAAADGLQVEVMDHASSSNALLLQRCAQGAASGTVLAVEWQTAGRGRLGRIWHSGLGDTLTFSLLWRFDGGLAALSGLSLAVGVAMMRALRELGVAGAGLKWPNDVLLNEGKLAGILIEAQGDMLGPSAVVIGIGLNLAVPEALRERIEQPVSDLISLDLPQAERNQVLAVSLKHLAEVLRGFGQGGFAPLRDEWERHHVYQGRAVMMLMPDGSHVNGTVLGVTDEGVLRLMTGQGERLFNAGEVSLRSA